MTAKTNPYSFLNARYADDKNPFGPRVQFNHGFHDATFDKENGTPRELSDSVHDTRHVSPTWDVMYFAGYRAGLAEQGRPQSSEPAWVAYRDNLLTNDQLREVFQAEVSAYQAGWSRKERNYWTLGMARKEASRICGVMM